MCRVLSCEDVYVWVLKCVLACSVCGCRPVCACVSVRHESPVVWSWDVGVLEARSPVLQGLEVGL